MHDANDGFFATEDAAKRVPRVRADGFHRGRRGEGLRSVGHDFEPGQCTLVSRSAISLLVGQAESVPCRDTEREAAATATERARIGLMPRLSRPANTPQTTSPAPALPMTAIEGAATEWTSLSSRRMAPLAPRVITTDRTPMARRRR